jgi:hypothetical protein
MNRTSGIEAGEGPSQFERDGCTVLEGYFSQARIDRAARAVGRLLRERPHEVVVDCLQSGRRTFLAQATHPETRRFKFNDLYLVSEEVRGLALDPELSAVLEDLMGEPAVLCNSLNFEKGSSQPRHIAPDPARPRCGVDRPRGCAPGRGPPGLLPGQPPDPALRLQ